MLDGASRNVLLLFYGVGIPVVLFSMLYKAKLNHTIERDDERKIW